MFFLLFFLHFLKNVYQLLRERTHKRGKGRHRNRGRHRIQCRLQALSCQHRVPHRALSHELWDHDLSRSQMLNRLRHPGCPVHSTLLTPTYGLSFPLRVPFNISFKTGLVVINSFNFSLSGKLFNSLSILNSNLACYSILGCRFLFFSFRIWIYHAIPFCSVKFLLKN